MQEENIRYLLEDYEFKNNLNVTTNLNKKSKFKNKENISDFLSESQKNYVSQVNM